MGESPSGNIPLSGVAFRLSNFYTGASAYTATSDKEGVLSFRGVVSGHYLLEELSAPAGYVPIKPLAVQVYSDVNGDTHIAYPSSTFEHDEKGRPIILNCLADPDNPVKPPSGDPGSAEPKDPATPLLGDSVEKLISILFLLMCIVVPLLFVAHRKRKA